VTPKFHFVGGTHAYLNNMHNYVRCRVSWLCITYVNFSAYEQIGQHIKSPYLFIMDFGSKFYILSILL